MSATAQRQARTAPSVLELDRGARARCRRVDGLGIPSALLAQVLHLDPVEVLRAEVEVEPRCGWDPFEEALRRGLVRRVRARLAAGWRWQDLRFAGWSAQEIRDAAEAADAR